MEHIFLPTTYIYYIGDIFVEIFCKTRIDGSYNSDVIIPGFGCFQLGLVISFCKLLRGING